MTFLVLLAILITMLGWWTQATAVGLIAGQIFLVLLAMGLFGMMWGKIFK